MGDIEVVTAGLRTAADNVDAAAEIVAAVTPATAVERVSSALPGSESDGKARGCSVVWANRIADWVVAAGAQKTSLEDSAANYDGSDADAYARMLRTRMGQ